MSFDNLRSRDTNCDICSYFQSTTIISLVTYSTEGSDTRCVTWPSLPLVTLVLIDLSLALMSWGLFSHKYGKNFSSRKLAHFMRNNQSTGLLKQESNLSGSGARTSCQTMSHEISASGSRLWAKKFTCRLSQGTSGSEKERSTPPDVTDSVLCIQNASLPFLRRKRAPHLPSWNTSHVSEVLHASLN